MNNRVTASIGSAVVLAALTLLACGETKTSDPAKYLAWIADPEHGLAIARTVRDRRVSVQYLPAEYRAFRQLTSGHAASQVARDSAKSVADRSVAFMVSVGPEGDDDAAAIVSDELRQRLEQAGTAAGDFAVLHADGRTYKPVLTTWDHDNGLGARRSVEVVFVDEQNPGRLADARAYDLVVQDDMLGTGINHFVFTRERLDDCIHLTY